VILVAHSLGCLAAAWWAEYEQPAQGNPVVGALLVAPPDAERAGVDERIARFAPVPRRPLPFPSFLAASENDRYCSLRIARGLASDWGSTFAYAGSVGHINADSQIGDWDFGLLLLGQLLREHRRRSCPESADGSIRRRPAAHGQAHVPWALEHPEQDQPRSW
jgi:predicted alpha/beta hydrolase family esterase